MTITEMESEYEKEEDQEDRGTISLKRFKMSTNPRLKEKNNFKKSCVQGAQERGDLTG